MNATLCRTTEQALDICDVRVTANGYETAPMQVVLPLFQQPNEEALHTSFEEAISDRQIALHSRLQHLHTSPLSGPLAPYTTDPIQSIAPVLASQHKRSIALHIQHNLRYMCLALIFTLVGFDMMGLLVLHMH